MGDVRPGGGEPWTAEPIPFVVLNVTDDGPRLHLATPMYRGGGPVFLSATDDTYVGTFGRCPDFAALMDQEEEREPVPVGGVARLVRWVERVSEAATVAVEVYRNPSPPLS